MNQVQNAPSNPGLTQSPGKTIGYQQRSPSSSTSDDSAYCTSPVFSSYDGISSQSSPLSSPGKSEHSWNGEKDQTIKSSIANSNGLPESARAIQLLTPPLQSQPFLVSPIVPPKRTSIQLQQILNQELEAVPLQNKESFQGNPRRTKAHSTSTSQGSVTCQTSNHGPPQLVRQCDRTQNFVENLVDTSSQMIEVIWPASILHCDKDYLGGKNLIGLRTFIQEVLKRSKTSYYTLQVALYYLILIQPHVPKNTCSQSQSERTHGQRAMQCGRRMFLAALILASKYLQDRNYSARAWSKISGLKISEINSNEMAFVTAVNWKLHIPEALFKRWTDIVYKYSTSQSSNSSGLLYGEVRRMTWQQVIPKLTPELNELDIDRFSRLSISEDGLQQPTLLSPLSQGYPMDEDNTPKLTAVKLVNPRPNNNNPPGPPREPHLPTPFVTPRIHGFEDTPAGRSWSQGQAMKETMHKHQKDSFNAYSNDAWPKGTGFSKSALRVISDGSIISSPESMISDTSGNSYSSRTSRSSSICSSASFGAQYDGCPRTVSIANHRSALSNLNGCSYVPAFVGRSEMIGDSNVVYADKAVADAAWVLGNLRRNGVDPTYKKENAPPRRMKTDVTNRKESGHKRTLSMAEEVKALPLQAFGLNETYINTKQPKSSVSSKPCKAKSHFQHRATPVIELGIRKKAKTSIHMTSWVL